MIMSARVLAGWIKPEDLQPAAEEAGEEAGEGEASAEGGTDTAAQG
jgi:hypothetical protein